MARINIEAEAVQCDVCQKIEIIIPGTKLVDWLEGTVSDKQWTACSPAHIKKAVLTAMGMLNND